MAPRLPNPLGSITGLPGDVVEALRHLPGIAEHTRVMREHTAQLERMADALDAVTGDTEALPELREVLRPLDDRMATIEAAMPVLVEVQTHLAKMPEAIERLDTRLEDLSETLERMVTSLEPMGRLARRFPGRERAPKDPAAEEDETAAR